MNANELIDSVIDGDSVDEAIDEIIGRKQRTARKPRKRRFRGRGQRVDPITGKRKDPRRSRMMRKVRRRHKGKFRRSAQRTARKLRTRGFYKKIGRMSGRSRR
jgi:hypothetical protein